MIYDSQLSECIAITKLFLTFKDQIVSRRRRLLLFYKSKERDSNRLYHLTVYTGGKCTTRLLNCWRFSFNNATRCWILARQTQQNTTVRAEDCYAYVITVRPIEANYRELHCQRPIRGYLRVVNHRYVKNVRRSSKSDLLILNLFLFFN